MNSNSFLRRQLVPVASLVIAAISAQAITPTRVVPLPSDTPNRLSGSIRMAFNVTTEFQNIAGFTSIGGMQFTPTGELYNYDDGYVLVDSTGNLMGYTRYWGYNYDSGELNQLPGDGTILMNRYSSSGATVGGNTDEPLPGFEINYRRELGRSDNWRWGMETAGNYMRVTTYQSSTVSSSVTRLTDAYQLPALEGGGFVNPPPAAYSHGPDLSLTGNTVIGATPISSTTDSFMTSVSGSRDFEADVIGWRVGPYVEFPLGKKGSVSLSGGFSLAYVGSDFHFDDVIALQDAPRTSGGGGDGKFVLGAYASGEVSYQLGNSWEVVGGVQFQHLENYRHQESGRSAVLDMGKSVFVSVGVHYSF